MLFIYGHSYPDAHTRQDKPGVMKYEWHTAWVKRCSSPFQENPVMQLPLTDADTLFEELLQALPAQIIPLAREFKAFVRAKKVKTPAQLLRLVF